MALLLLLIGGTGGTAHAQVNVTGFYQFSGSDYLYDFRITNNTPGGLDLAAVDLLLTATDDIFDLTAPTGFLADFDSTTDSLTFLEDADPLTTQTFAAGSTVSGFTFRSSVLLPPSTFTALDTDGTSFIGTTSITPAAAVPEAGTLVLAVASCVSLVVLSALLGRLRRFTPLRKGKLPHAVV